jgi:hypothetical protein
MTTLADIKRQLANLSAGEKTELLQRIVREGSTLPTSTEPHSLFFK